MNKQCGFRLFTHAVNWKIFGTKNSALDCVGLFGEDSIIFNKNTLPATSVVVPVLIEPTKKALLAINWKVFGTKTVLWTFFHILFIAAWN